MFKFNIFRLIGIFILLIFCVKSETIDNSTECEEFNFMKIFNVQTEMFKFGIETMRFKVEEMNITTEGIKQLVEENSKKLLQSNSNIELLLENEKKEILNLKNEVQNLKILINNSKQQTLKPKYDKQFNCLENCRPIHNLPRDCNQAMLLNISSLDGIYLLNIPNRGLKPFYTYCKRYDNTVWTVIQRREDNSVDFNRNWEDYKNGFGNLDGEFWLGLERLHHFTKYNSYELYIRMELENGEKSYANYKKFSIANKTDKYKLTVYEYLGDTGDSFRDHNGMKFSTFDNCNDNHINGYKECAIFMTGGWWLDNCGISNLNGQFFPRTDTHSQGILWNNKAYKFSEMMIRAL